MTQDFIEHSSPKKRIHCVMKEDSEGHRCYNVLQIFAVEKQNCIDWYTKLTV